MRVIPAAIGIAAGLAGGSLLVIGLALWFRFGRDIYASRLLSGIANCF